MIINKKCRLSELSSERKVSRTATNIHILGVVADEPILSLRVPVHDISSHDVSRESDGLIGLDAQSLETSEHLDSIVGATKRDVELRNLNTANLSDVLDLGGDAVDDVPQHGVTTGRTRSGKTRLRRRVDSTLGNEADITVRSILRLAGGGRKVGRVDPGVEVQGNTREVAREDRVGSVHADVTIGLSSRSHAGSRGVSAGVQLGDLDVAVGEVCVRKTESKFVDRLNLLLVKGSVINEDALLEVGLRNLVIRCVQDISAVVRTFSGHGEGKLGTRVDTTIEDISNRVTGLLSRNTSPEDGGDVGVVGVFLNENRGLSE